MKKNQISRKHVGKKVTSEQDFIISEIYKKKKCTTWLQAKHEYFENQAKYDKEIKFEEDVTGADEDDMKAVVKDIKKRKDTTAERIVQSCEKEVEKITIELKKKSRTLTISETKLGITMVLTKEDCLKMGFKGTEMTRDAIKAVRAKLGLPEKPIRS